MDSPLLDVQDVSIAFDGVRVLNGLSLALAPGETRFLIGPNGAGKTTLLDLICGILRPQQGRVIFDGHDVARLPAHQLVRLGMGRKFQTPAIFPSLSVQHNLECAASSMDFGLSLLRPAHAQQRERIRDVLSLTGLSAQAPQRAGTLSHGQQQWLEIAMLLVHRPRLLLLDEPVAGLTRAERHRTADLLGSIRSECALLIVEHDMAFVRQLEADVTVLYQGQVLVEGPMHEVQRDERVIEIYLGKPDALEAAIQQ